MSRLIAGRLGFSPQEANLLNARAWRRLGWRQYGSRAVAFVLATTPLVRNAIPGRLRRRAIEPFLYALMPDQHEIILYVDPAQVADDG